MSFPKWITENIPTEISSSDIFRFKINLPTYGIVEVDLNQDLDIDFDILEDTLERVPAQYMYWSAIYSELKSQCTILDDAINKRRAFLTRTMLAEYKKQGIKLTDSQLRQLVDADSVDLNEIRDRLLCDRMKQSAMDPGFKQSDDDLEIMAQEEFKLQRRSTIEYLKAQLIIMQRNTGKVYNMLRAIEMRSEHCRSLAGFKRQDKTQSNLLT